MYAVTAIRHVNCPQDGWFSQEQVPTFFLDESVQGIIHDDHARRIALDILGGEKGTVDVHVEKIS